MQSKKYSGARGLIKIAITAGLMSAACVPAAFAAPAATDGSDPSTVPSMVQAQAIQSWHEDMVRTSAPAEGCFQASFPSILWKPVPCTQVRPFTHPLPRHTNSLTRLTETSSSGGTQTTGNGNDYAIEVSGLISSATGNFPSVTGVTSEKSVGVPAFGGGGILGPNEYTLQVNSNYNRTTSACKSHSGCTVWQQFIYSPDYSTKGKAAVFIQYWLLGYGGTRCPTGFGSDGAGDCYKNSAAVTAPDVPATQLANLKISGTATTGGNDKVVFTNGTTAYTLSAKDTVLDIASAWDQTEFNVVGNAGGSEAVFNSGSSVTVKLAVADGSTTKPTCAANAGSTGESNNLTLGKCTASAGTSPSIQFIESN